ncbi:hypothetical protein V6N13_020556 [Hibiscus sabdariffa]
MAEGEEFIELRFRLYDGKDIAHGTYNSSMTVSTLKQKIVAEWPQGYVLSLYWFPPLNSLLAEFCNTVTPKSINDLKLIHAGKVLENNTTLAECTITIGDLPDDVITMHVLVHPSKSKRKIVKSKEDMQKLNPFLEDQLQHQVAAGALSKVAARP